MNWDKFKDRFHESWHPIVKPFIESKECDQMYNKIREGKNILPSSDLTFRAFKETPYDTMRVAIIGYCPYHMVYKDIPVADGLAFSCGNTKKAQPSLVKMIQGIAWEYSVIPPDIYDLTYLAKQGVFLYNVALTVEKDKPGSHQEIWEPFSKIIINSLKCPILFLGKEAQKFKKYVNPFNISPLINLEHPAYAARTGDKWDTKDAFKSINAYLEFMEIEPVQWIGNIKTSP